MKKTLLLALTVLSIVILVSCHAIEPYDAWPTTGLGAMLPAPDSENIRIGYELDDSFNADIEKATDADFQAYISKCKKAGFIIDVEKSSDNFSAYNQDGYRVEFHFYESLQCISIYLHTPKVNGTFTWPTIGLATLIPQPQTNIGTISIDSSSQFIAYIGETSLDDYKAYVNQCIEFGFDVDFSNSEKLFTADNADGISLRLEYQGFNTMYISVYTPDEETTDTESTSKDPSNPEKPTTEAPSDNSIRSDFKAAMDSYEVFFDKYCAFMKKYNESDDPLSLMDEYSEYMKQYADTMSKMNALKTDSLSDAELQYYIEVNNRITKKLLELT